MKRQIITFILFILCHGCGLTSPKYIDYTSASAGTLVDASSTCGQEALAVYAEQIANAVDGTCAGSSCHGASAGGFTLTAGDNEANRTALYNYTAFEASTLFGKISGSHGGGDQSATLPEANISTWLTKEQACATE